MKALGICLCIIVAVAASSEIRGVAPYEQTFYKGDTFKCRNEPTKQIPISRVNDNYCDCADGSDEPGTSACIKGIFYCVNKGYKGVTLFSSQVNDGICDCCDGSDEFEGTVKCNNDCAARGAELRKQQEEEKARIEKGLQTKQQWIQDAEKTLTEKRNSIDGQKAEVEKLKKVVEDLEAEKRGFEEKEKAEQDVINERKKELDRIAQEKLQQEAPPTPETEASEQEALKELIQKNDENPTPPEQEEHAHHEPEEHQPPQPEEETELLKTIREGAPQESQLAQTSWIFVTYESVKNWIVDFLQSYHILSTEDESRLAFYAEGKRKIEDELSQVRRDLSTAESDLRSTEEILGRDFGKNSEFFGLNGNCYEYKAREYTYSMCPYGEVKQGHTSLGRFENWDPAYTVMSFTNGQQCWGGPKRSARVTFVCGADNELTDIQEPNKCEYSMKFFTPAACTSNPLEFLAHGEGAEGEHHGNYFPQ